MKVIAINSFTDNEGEWHPYGQEFDEPDGPRLDGWLKDGTVRVDDRMSAQPQKASAKKK